MSAAILQEVANDTDKLLLHKARTDLLAFTLHTKEDYQIGWHHRALARKLNAWMRGEIQYLMVFMPPRHGKSELVSRRLPAMLHGLYPDAELMCASYNDSLAGEMCIAVQNIIDSPAYKEIFPHVSIPAPRTNYMGYSRSSEGHPIIDYRGKYRGQGVGGSFTGKGANFIIVDDPIKGREVADSVAFRERLWNFWNNDLFSRMETNLITGRPGQALITQTRWHEDDLSGRLLEKMRNDKTAVQWDILNYPAIRSDMDDSTDTRLIGEALWPKKYNIDQLNAIKASAGARAWSSLYQQNPVPDGGTIFNDGMFKFVTMPTAFDYQFVTLDTAYKEKQENDFTVASLWGVVSGQIYLIDVLMKQIKATEIEAVFGAWINSKRCYGFRQVWIEPKGHGIYLNQKWMSSGFIPSDLDVSIFFKDRHLDKSERANNVAPNLASRYIGINLNIANKEDLVAQCIGFPKVKHDDFVDTLIDALKKVYGASYGILDLF